jgi:hypothetical protein
MRRDQTAHERLIPLLVEIVGARTYLEIGTHQNQTIGKVACPVRIGVDPAGVNMPDVTMYKMPCGQFLEAHAESHAPYDVVFIDGDHSASAVRADFMGLWPYVADDGMIILHDMQPEHESDAQPGYCGDSWKMGMHIVGGYEACTLNYHPGLMLVRKRSRWGPLP